MRHPNSIIEFSNVFYQYPNNSDWILKNVNFSIPKGSFCLLTGSVGSGKSTLLSLIRGLNLDYGKFKGKIIIDGEDIRETDIVKLGSKIAIVFQNPVPQLHQLTVIDELQSGPLYQGLNWEECKKRAIEAATLTLDESFFEKSPTELSLGQQQRVVIAACLAMKVEILLLDEPFSFMDEESSIKLIKLLWDLKKKGITIVLSAHNYEHLIDIADIFLTVNNGTVDSPLKMEKPITKEKIAFKTKENNNKILFEAKELYYKYSNGTIGLNKFSISLREGEIVGIIGSNGSGKSTFAKCALNLLKPQKGEIKLFEKEIKKYSLQEIAKNIGYISQNPNDMLFEDTVLNECLFGPIMLKLDKPLERVEEILNNLKLLSLKKQHPKSLSGGQQRLISIADILVNTPKIYIFDEPEFGLDDNS